MLFTREQREAAAEVLPHFWVCRTSRRVSRGMFCRSRRSLFNRAMLALASILVFFALLFSLLPFLFLLLYLSHLFIDSLPISPTLILVYLFSFFYAPCFSSFLSLSFRSLSVFPFQCPALDLASSFFCMLTGAFPDCLSARPVDLLLLCLN
ncbi:hypothetical protein BDV10DRAFT_57698 [Aspergillus recurvatus]